MINHLQLHVFKLTHYNRMTDKTSKLQTWEGWTFLKNRMNLIIFILKRFLVSTSDVSRSVLLSFARKTGGKYMGNSWWYDSSKSTKGRKYSDAEGTFNTLWSPPTPRLHATISSSSTLTFCAKNINTTLVVRYKRHHQQTLPTPPSPFNLYSNPQTLY